MPTSIVIPRSKQWIKIVYYYKDRPPSIVPLLSEFPGSFAANRAYAFTIHYSRHIDTGSNFIGHIRGNIKLNSAETKLLQSIFEINNEHAIIDNEFKMRLLQEELKTKDHISFGEYLSRAITTNKQPHDAEIYFQANNDLADLFYKQESEVWNWRNKLDNNL